MREPADALEPTAIFALPRYPSRMFDLTTAAVIYSLLLAAFFLSLWIYYDRRDHARFEAEHRRTIFHCVKCDRVYTKRGDHLEANCPHCQFENGHLRF